MDNSKSAGVEGTDRGIATILSVAMMLRYSLRLEKEASAMEKAVISVLETGYRTYDIVEKGKGKDKVGTRKMGDLIAAGVGRGV